MAEDDSYEEFESNMSNTYKIPIYVNGLPLQVEKIRGDVALKAILRYMRKHYLSDFKRVTRYVSYNKRNKNKNEL